MTPPDRSRSSLWPWPPPLRPCPDVRPGRGRRSQRRQRLGPAAPQAVEEPAGGSGHPGRRRRPGRLDQHHDIRLEPRRAVRDPDFADVERPAGPRSGRSWPRRAPSPDGSLPFDEAPGDPQPPGLLGLGRPGRVVAPACLGELPSVPVLQVHPAVVMVVVVLVTQQHQVAGSALVCPHGDLGTSSSDLRTDQ